MGECHYSGVLDVIRKSPKVEKVGPGISVISSLAVLYFAGVLYMDSWMKLRENPRLFCASCISRALQTVAATRGSSTLFMVLGICMVALIGGKWDFRKISQG